MAAGAGAKQQKPRRGMRLAAVGAAGLGLFFYAEYTTYGLPAPNVAGDPVEMPSPPAPWPAVASLAPPPLKAPAQAEQPVPEASIPVAVAAARERPRGDPPIAVAPVIVAPIVVTPVVLAPVEDAAAANAPIQRPPVTAAPVGGFSPTVAVSAEPPPATPLPPERPSAGVPAAEAGPSAPAFAGPSAAIVPEPAVPPVSLPALPVAPSPEATRVARDVVDSPVAAEPEPSTPPTPSLPPLPLALAADIGPHGGEPADATRAVEPSPAVPAAPSLPSLPVALVLETKPADREFVDAPAVVEPEAPATAAIALPAPPAAAGEPKAPAVAALADLTPAAGVQVAALTPGPLPQVVPAPESHPVPPSSALAAPWRLNAVAFAERPGLKMVAIIIDDAGVDRVRTARALRLPAPLTISFLPYAAEIARQTREARERGHELMLHLPMEPISPFGYPGPDALTMALPREELLRRLALNLARFDGYVGVNNHMGSRITQSRDAMLPVLETLRDRGLLFVDSRTSGASVAAGLADGLHMPGAARDVFIDHDADEISVRARLADIERIALRAGYAVAIGHPHDVTLAALERWLPGLAGRGLTLAPVSAVAARRQEAR